MDFSDLLIVYTYAVYLFVSIGLTMWVAHTLHKNGRIFLIEAFAGNKELADSVNHLLVVGFYLVNIGYVSLALKEAVKPTTIPAVIETLSSKIGIVLLVLGAMHFFNLAIFSSMRKRALGETPRAPLAPGPRPVMGTGH